MPNPLRNLGWEAIIEFLVHCGCYEGGNSGDDIVYYHPKNPTMGILINRAPKYRRSGYPIGTLNYNIRCLYLISGIRKQQWRDWFREKRNF